MERDLDFFAKTKLFLQRRENPGTPRPCFRHKAVQSEASYSCAYKLDKESACFSRLARFTPNRQITCIGAARPFSAAHSMKIEERVMTTIEKTPLAAWIRRDASSMPYSKVRRQAWRSDFAKTSHEVSAQLADEKRPRNFRSNRFSRLPRRGGDDSHSGRAICNSFAYLEPVAKVLGDL